MEYKGKEIRNITRFLNQYIQKHVTHSFQIRPMINFIKSQNWKDIVGVEIGVFHGKNSYSILKNLHMKKLYLVDPYQIYDERDNVYDRNKKDFKQAHQLLKPFQNKRFIIKTSEDAVNEIPNNLDFVYIDGNHDYKHVKQDIEKYYPKIKSKGIIGGHDFRADYECICRAVLEFVDENHLILQGWKIDWWIVKP